MRSHPGLPDLPLLARTQNAEDHRAAHTRPLGWTGYGGPIMSGWASMGQTREESKKTMARLIESEGLPSDD
jgi:hypothetical protein